MAKWATSSYKTLLGSQERVHIDWSICSSFILKQSIDQNNDTSENKKKKQFQLFNIDASSELNIF